MKTIMISAVLALGISTTAQVGYCLPSAEGFHPSKAKPVSIAHFYRRSATTVSYDNKAIHHTMAAITLNLAKKYEHKALVIGDTSRAKWYHREYLRALHILKEG